MTIRDDLVALATPRRTAAEAISRSRENGVEITSATENSYTFAGPCGRFLFEGASIIDECYVNDPLGMLNISKAWRITRDLGAPKPEKFPIDAGLLAHLTGTEVDDARVDEMTVQRRDLPALFVMHPQGMFLIDGAHRIAARVRAGLDWVHGYSLSSHSMATIQVRLFRLENGGRRTEIDTTKGWASIAGGSS